MKYLVVLIALIFIAGCKFISGVVGDIQSPNGDSIVITQETLNYIKAVLCFVFNLLKPFIGQFLGLEL